MSLTTCPECSAEISDQAAPCPQCGRAATRFVSPPRAAISGLSGQLKAVGTVTVTLAVIATASGFWWGPALFLPGIAVFMFGMSA